MSHHRFSTPNIYPALTYPARNCVVRHSSRPNATSSKTLLLFSVRHESFLKSLCHSSHAVAVVASIFGALLVGGAVQAEPTKASPVQVLSVPVVPSKVEAEQSTSVQVSSTPEQTSAYTANIHRYSAPDGALESVSRILLSKEGIKVTELRGDSAQPVNAFIHNFTHDRVWIESLQFKRYVELPVVENDASEPPAVAADIHQSGLLTSVPCIGFIPTFDAVAVWRGIEVEIWHCRLNSAVIVHTYDPERALVVREDYPDGRYAELTDYREVYIGVDTFFPNANHEAVHPDDFFHRRETLKPFDVSG